MGEKLDINLRIAGIKLSLTISAAEEEKLRSVTKEVNKVYETYTKRFPGSAPEEVLAKVTLLFARGYLSMSDQTSALVQQLDELDRQFDALLEQVP